MKKIVLSLLITTTIVYLTSCARGISPYEAANGKAKCGKRYIR